MKQKSTTRLRVELSCLGQFVQLVAAPSAIALAIGPDTDPDVLVPVTPSTADATHHADALTLLRASVTLLE